MNAIPQEFYSLEAEQAVIGSLLQDNRCWTLVGQKLSAEVFFRADHREFFRAIADLARKGEAFDFVTLVGMLESDSRAYLWEIVRNTPSTANVETYAGIVLERFKRRQVSAVGMFAMDVSRNAESSVDAIAQVRAKLDAIGTHDTAGAVSVDQTVADWVQIMMDRRDRGGRLQGLQTGLNTIDRRWFGLCAPDLIIIAGRPSMGKTTFGMNIAEGAARAGASVLVFSLEMSTSQLLDRRVAAIAGLPLGEIRECNMSSDDAWDRITDATHTIRNRKLFINDASALTVDGLRLAAAAHKAKHGLDLVVVDYLGLLTSPGAESRLQEVRMISKGLKQLAKELNIPVVALAQLNRKSEERTNKRPLMSDLRESGDIEQDADIIAFVHRQEKYEPDNADWKGIAEIITEKHRNGEVGTDYLASQLHFARFVELEREFSKPVDYKTRAANGARDL